MTDRPKLAPMITKRPEPTAPAHLRGYLALDDFRTCAAKRLPLPIFGYVDGGVETGASVVVP